MSHCGGCASARDRCGNGLEKIYPTTAVRYGSMKHIGEFTHLPDLAFTCGAKVVIATDRGIEIGEQVSLTCHGCERSVTRDQMREYARASGGDALRLNNGKILREATESDLVEMRHIEDGVFDKIQTCRHFAEELGLQMKIVDGEHIFGGERIIFYFMAEDRVDFREMVRRLAREFQTRIEMKQVGARDEARLLADYETCGRECCCKNFLKTLKPVSMSMAKLQKATLDPSKVSGRCGRLKCCLRYEHESYESLNKQLPRLGKRIRTAAEIGKVIDRQVLTQLLKIRTDDGRIVAVVNEDVIERDLPEPVLTEEQATAAAGECEPRSNRRPLRDASPPRPVRRPGEWGPETGRRGARDLPAEEPPGAMPEGEPADEVGEEQAIAEAEVDSASVETVEPAPGANAPPAAAGAQGQSSAEQPHRRRGRHRHRRRPRGRRHRPSGGPDGGRSGGGRGGA